ARGIATGAEPPLRVAPARRRDRRASTADSVEKPGLPLSPPARWRAAGLRRDERARESPGLYLHPPGHSGDLRRRADRRQPAPEVAGAQRQPADRDTQRSGLADRRGEPPAGIQPGLSR